MIDPHLQNHFRELGFLISSIKSGSYVGIFLLSMLIGYIVPLPEVVAAMLYGFIGATTNLNIFVVLSLAFLGAIAGDNGLYWLSYMGNTWVEKLNRKMRQHELIRYEHLVADNIGKTIYFLRLVAGVRFFGPVIAGSLGAPWKKFFLSNFGATLLNTVIFVGLGYYFHHHIFSVIAEVEIIRNMLLFFSAIIVAFLLSVFAQKEKPSSEK